ncbi:transcriptional regulator, TetR family [Bradyrhizobium sp. Rc2d]|nr:transcriptional regulator, TetR family [Bradyrhizobium sp. Rc2d]
MNTNSKEVILAAAKRAAQAHGYNGLNFRDLATEVGIRAPSIYHHFPSKADLGAAVARRYWEDTAANLEAISAETSDPVHSLHEYPNIFRKSLESDNRLCLGSFMSAEYDDLPEAVKKEVQAFADVNVAWLSRTLVAAGLVRREESEARARSIYAAVAGAQLMARSRSDISLFDALIDGYRAAGLLPADGTGKPELRVNGRSGSAKRSSTATRRRPK